MARISPQEQAALEQSAYKKHVTSKIRSEWGASIPSDADDDELLSVWQELNVPKDATTDEMNDVLNEMYAQDYIPPKMKDQRTFMEKTQDVGSAIAPAVGPIAANIGAAVSSAVPAMGKLAKGLGKSVPGQLGMAGYYGTKLAGAQLAGSSLEKTAGNVPAPDIADLKRRGYSAKQIRNIQQGYIDTQQSLMGDVQQMGKEGTSTAVEALANAAVLPMTAGALESVVGGVAGKAAIGGGLSNIAGQAAGKIAGRAAGGALIGGTFGGGARVVERATEVVEKGGSADEVLGYMTGGLLGNNDTTPADTVEGEGATNPIGDFTEGFKETWGFGAAFGGAIGAVEAAAMAGRGVVGARQLRKLEDLKKARTVSITNFGENFKPDDLIQRFGADLTAADAAGLDDVALAASIVGKLHPDMAPTEAGLKAIALISEKIKPWRKWKQNLEGPPTGLGRTKPPGAPDDFVSEVPGALPTNAPRTSALIAPDTVNTTPETKASESLQMPVGSGDRRLNFVPPTGDIAPVPGMELPMANQGVAQAFPEIAPEVSVPSSEAPVAPTTVLNRGPAIVPENLPPVLQGPLGIAENRQFVPPSGVARAEGIEFGKLPSKTVEHAIAAIKLNPPKGVNIEVAPSADGGHLELTKLSGIEEGSSGPALAQITKVADLRGLPVQARLIPQSGPKGGRIPVEKLTAWYEKQGFKVVEKGEGFAVVRREPRLTAVPDIELVGAVQHKIASGLHEMAFRALHRLDSRRGRLNAGIDPADIRDYSLVLASDMFTRSIRTKAELRKWATSKWGKDVEPILDEVIARAQKHFVRMFKTPGVAEKNLKTLMELGDSGRHGADWYEKTADWATKNFGEDSDMMLRFLAVTSANGQTEGGATMALKAFAQWKSGMPFEGFRGDSMVGQLKRAASGEQIGSEFSKIENFYRALKGDKDAIVLDRWMIDALNLKSKGGALRENDYRIYTQVVEDLAEMNGMTPRQFQAAVWEGARIRKAHVSEKLGGRKLTTKSGSARPLEDLVDRKLGGMTIDEYIAANKGNLSSMENLYNGLAPVRKGEVTGHSFDPETWQPSTKDGYLASMASTVIPRNELYPAAVLKFAKHFGPLMKEHPGKFNVGLWSMDDGSVSIDLNLIVQTEKEAVSLGFKNRQYAVGQLADGGQYQGNIKTGYSPDVHGPQFLPPSEGPKQASWFKQQANRVRSFLRNDPTLFEQE